MSAVLRPPGTLKRFWVERRARRFSDPIEKLAYLRRSARTGSPTSGKRRRLSWYWDVSLLLLLFLAVRIETARNASAGLARKPAAPSVSVAQPVSGAPEAVWVVEHASDHEIYSNGLRLENRYLSPNVARAYIIFRDGATPGANVDWHSEPAGIVFHTSESIQAPFTSDQNTALTRIGDELLKYVSRRQAYHFVIDRFGRVFRVVPETDVANHAGYSVWADEKGTYVNLNHSFLGISFEAHTRDVDEGCYLSDAQIHSGLLLVQMLRSKYNIPATNCVTHAQVSVNPDSMTIGHHTDGSGDFPFDKMGLPDNYSLPIPSLYHFGFDYDPRFLISTGARMWKSVLLADERLRREADSRRLTAGQYKEILRERYRTSIETLKNLGVLKEE